MRTINRRSAIKAGLIGAGSIPLLPVGNAVAQSRLVSHSGHRVLPREQNVFGLSSLIITDSEPGNSLPELTNVVSIQRTGDKDYVEHVARLLEASYKNSPDSLEYITGNEFREDVGRILEEEPIAMQMLANPNSRFYWAKVNPWILVVIIPSGTIAIGTAVGVTAWTLRPFVGGFLDEAGRDVWRWMRSWFS